MSVISVLPSPSLHSTLQIKEKKEEPTSPPPPLSALPGGFLKQLVRETEKETKQKEPEVKEEKAVREREMKG